MPVEDQPPGQDVRHVDGRLEPVFRLLRHHLGADPQQVDRGVGSLLADVGRSLLLVHHDPLGQRPVGKRRVAAE